MILNNSSNQLRKYLNHLDLNTKLPFEFFQDVLSKNRTIKFRFYSTLMKFES